MAVFNDSKIPNHNYLNKIVRNTGQEPVCIAYSTSDAMGTISGLLKELDCKLNGDGKNK